MHFAFCLYKYFPFGGLSNDCLRIAHRCVARGHKVTVYALKWQGEKHNGIDVKLLKRMPVQLKYRTFRYFSHTIANMQATRQYHCVVGFNKIPGIDVYFAADPCFAEKMKHRAWIARVSARPRYLLKAERAIFAQDSKTHILHLTQVQRHAFIQHYATAKERFHLLPPGICRDRIIDESAAQYRQQLRAQLQCDTDQYVLLFLGSGFRTKGLDRVLVALKALDTDIRARTTLLIVGQDKSRAFLRLARRLNIAEHVRFLGPRHDVPALLQAADCLVHPAYYEAAGHVLIEAIVAGLPIITTASCGYSPYVEKANMGVVLPEPFDQKAFNTHLHKQIVNLQQTDWRARGLAYANAQDLYSLADVAAKTIEQIAKDKQ